jgi:hypothetical protein
VYPSLPPFWWVPCHYGMARLRVADGGDGLQMWRVVANILTKQLWIANKGWTTSFRGWAWGEQTLTVKNSLVTKFHKEPRAWADSLEICPKLKKI